MRRSSSTGQDTDAMEDMQAATDSPTRTVNRRLAVETAAHR
jgi:hypothetical protein